MVESLTFDEARDEGYEVITEKEFQDAVRNEADAYIFEAPFQCTIKTEGELCLSTRCIGPIGQRYRYASFCSDGVCKQRLRKRCADNEAN
jgi:hypothetical protein